jgi:hypothetical protein
VNRELISVAIMFTNGATVFAPCVDNYYSITIIVKYHIFAKPLTFTYSITQKSYSNRISYQNLKVLVGVFDIVAYYKEAWAFNFLVEIDL